MQLLRLVTKLYSALLSYLFYTGRSHHVYLVLQKDVHDHVLSVVTGNMEGSAAMGIDCIRL